ncbi:MAG: C2 family cysteine protease, partial [Beijerinckiaceae bacterium]
EPTGQWIDVSSSNLSNVDYIGGPAAASQTLYVDVYDATVGTWSADSSFTATTTAPSVLNSLQDAGIRADVGKLMVNDSLSYQSMLTILDDAAVGGMNASKFSTLQTLASMLNATGGISTSTYVQDITNSLIDGDPANQYWTGGASTSVALGNLSATSTQTEVDELIGKWFLGTDLPSMNLSGIGDPNYNPIYEADNASLFGTSGTPSYLDVNQGNLGDCYFMAALAEVALQDPSAIESMITPNSNGTYGVRFFVNGTAEYVTVDNDLPNMSGGYQWANGSTLEFANGASGTPMWAELVEKAFAQLNAEPDAVHGGTLNSASNSYEGLDSGYPGAALEEITGQSSTSYAPGQLVSDASVIGSAFASGEEVEVDTPGGNDNGNLVADHSLEVIGYNSITETFTLHNPWGSGYGGPLQMTFTETASALAADNCWMVVAAGTGSVGTGTITGGDVLGVDIPASGNLAFVAPIGTPQLDIPSSFSGTVAGLGGQDASDLWRIDPAAVHSSYSAANFAGHSA